MKAIADREDRGAKVTRHAKKVEGTLEVPGLVASIEKLIALKQEHSDKKHQQMTEAIDSLVKAIEGIKPTEAPDLKELVAAVLSLKRDAVEMHEPMDYRMTFERDPQRHLIDGEKGVVFTASPRKLNS